MLNLTGKFIHLHEASYQIKYPIVICCAPNRAIGPAMDGTKANHDEEYTEGFY